MYTLIRTNYNDKSGNDVILTAGTLTDFNGKIIAWVGGNPTDMLDKSTFIASLMDTNADIGGDTAWVTITNPRNLNFLLGAISTLPDKLDFIKETFPLVLSNKDANFVYVAMQVVTELLELAYSDHYVDENHKGYAIGLLSGYTAKYIQ